MVRLVSRTRNMWLSFPLFKVLVLFLPFLSYTFIHPLELIFIFIQFSSSVFKLIFNRLNQIYMQTNRLFIIREKKENLVSSKKNNQTFFLYLLRGMDLLASCFIKFKIFKMFSQVPPHLPPSSLCG